MKRKELSLEEMESRTGVNRTEECLADYWACRNTLLEEYGEEHFFDLDRVITEEARKKLESLMDRYVREVRRKAYGAA